MKASPKTLLVTLVLAGISFAVSACRQSLPVELVIRNDSNHDISNVAIEVGSERLDLESLSDRSKTEKVPLQSSADSLHMTWTDDQGKYYDESIDEIPPADSGVLEAWTLVVEPDGVLRLDREPIAVGGGS